MSYLTEIRSCPRCQTRFGPGSANQQHCSVGCARTAKLERDRRRAARLHAERQSQRPVRVCEICHRADISDRPAYTKYCRTCRRSRSHASASQSLKLAVAKYRGAHPTQTAAKKLTRPKPAPKDGSLPNLAGPDWWPGWDGCYSPNLSPLQKELLERQTARFRPSQSSNNSSGTAFRGLPQKESA